MSKAKQEKLEEIAKEIESCKICKTNKHGKAVPGEGNADAEVIFVGEAPGKLEAESGRPFIGRSGKLLRKMIIESGLKESDVYITSPVKYLPDYITPTSQDILHGRIHFDEQVDVINPSLIVLLGRVASEAVLGRKISVVAEHGKVIHENNRNMFVTVHPAAALRFTKMREILNEDFKVLKRTILKDL